MKSMSSLYAKIEAILAESHRAALSEWVETGSREALRKAAELNHAWTEAVIARRKYAR